jgi:hypothetical protein
LYAVHTDGEVLDSVGEKLAAELWVLKEQGAEGTQEVFRAIAVLLQSAQVSGDLPMKLGIIPPFFLTIQQQEESEGNRQTQKGGQPNPVQRLPCAGIGRAIYTGKVESIGHEAE